MEYADERLGFPKIRAVFEPKNLASAKLCEKLGFIEEGQVRLGGKNMLQYVYKGTVNYEKD
jgi:RimJ/RimL family protein N-acetyltransferase